MCQIKSTMTFETFDANSFFIFSAFVAKKRKGCIYVKQIGHFAAWYASVFFLSICFSVILFNICLSTPTWFYHIAKRTTTSKILNDTSVSCAPYSLWVDIFEILHQIMIPFVLMFLFTFMMVKYVFKSRIKTTNFSTSSSNTSSNDRKFAISSTTINIMFLLFNFPHFEMYFFKQYSNLYQNSLQLFSLLEALTYFLLYVNLITTFFINYIVNSMFKSEFEIMFYK